MAIVNLLFQEDSLIIKAEGQLNSKELVKYSYMALICQKKPEILWDLSAASMNEITSEEITSSAKQMQLYKDLPKEAKIAFLAGTSGDFGMLRMYESQLHHKGFSYQYSVFKELDKAKEWLNSSH